MLYDVEQSCYVSTVTPLSAAAAEEQHNVSKLADAQAKVLGLYFLESSHT